MANLHIVEAEVLGDINNGYRLKISVLDIGVYVYGFTVRRSDKNSSGWWVQPPATNVKGKWVSTIEFDKSKSLWVEVEQACLEQVKLQEQGNRAYTPTDEEMTDKSIADSLKAIPWLDEDEPL